MKQKIAAEIYKAAERLGAGPELLSILGSYGDTLEDDDILQMLKDFNETGECLHTVQ